MVDEPDNESLWLDVTEEGEWRVYSAPHGAIPSEL
jgi:hypothetical protein